MCPPSDGAPVLRLLVHHYTFWSGNSPALLGRLFSTAYLQNLSVEGARLAVLTAVVLVFTSMSVI